MGKEERQSKNKSSKEHKISLTQATKCFAMNLGLGEALIF
jgi:hypothetical protein